MLQSPFHCTFHYIWYFVGGGNLPFLKICELTSQVQKLRINQVEGSYLLSLFESFKHIDMCAHIFRLVSTSMKANIIYLFSKVRLNFNRRIAPKTSMHRQCAISLNLILIIHVICQHIVCFHNILYVSWSFNPFFKNVFLISLIGYKQRQAGASRMVHLMEIA